LKPVVIFEHDPGVTAGFLAEYLGQREIPFEILAVHRGEAVPRAAAAYAGLAFMGGPMSVNNPLPWIAEEIALIRDAVERSVPVLGHCLGGQLMARALGGTVGDNGQWEIGWGRVDLLESPAARHWLGDDLTGFDAFHWHYETFTVPKDAIRILQSAGCANQAFVLGPHLAMQFHVEMTPALVQQWVDKSRQRLACIRSPYAQQEDTILAGLEQKTAAQQAIARRLYGRWLAGLAS
jgi:GMP synthase-like glutamine amidotransferase